MPLRWPALLGSSNHSAHSLGAGWIFLGIFSIWLALASAMTPKRIAELRQETVEMFYHGFDNYMDIAFPEDELRPVSCVPLTRDQRNPRNVEINDVLGNYSLTLIDSLSTLAILASAPPDQLRTGAKALRDFQDGVESLVLQYGDGTTGATGKGLRGRGFDVDSKVQVFETVIRGVGGLLSAHLFAAGELPIAGYNPTPTQPSKKKLQKGEIPAVAWPNGFKYDGQLLRLALDLAQRLLPAFYTTTGMPYPRVNLRHGIPFYLNSPLHQDTPEDLERDGPQEITETCSAGAGSLVLEFTVLSRLTGDPRFEQLAKRAFWAVWSRRSPIGLLGAGVDAENGHWIGPYSGIGAGTDSFFEYALKTHILLSGHDQPNLTMPLQEPHQSWLDPNSIFAPLTTDENSPEAFLAAWHEAHAAVKRHLYSGIHHPHYVNVHLSTGSPQAYWIDSLGAYYPGLLTLAGEVDEAIETNLLYTALWTRYAALPERWSVKDGHVEGGLGWWPGRPEFIESNYHLYRATRDPWYLHVGEMVLKDIKRRCWTECGWSGLQDVITGEKSDRMESFFLGETAKYLYLLFDPEHPLNKLDAAYVFTTEGHPLIIPKEKASIPKRKKVATKELITNTGEQLRDTCPVPPPAIPFTISNTAARPDIFHAASLIGLDRIPNFHIETSPHQTSSHSTPSKPEVMTNYTYYPWTLPSNLIPTNGSCDRIPIKPTFTIEFPNQAVPQTSSTSNDNFVVFAAQNLIRVDRGIYVKSLSALKLGMVHESPSPYRAIDGGQLMESWRVWSIAGMPLGRDEQIFIPRDVIGEMNDPSFTRVRDSVMLDLVLQMNSFDDSMNITDIPEDETYDDDELYEMDVDEKVSGAGLAKEYATLLSSLLSSFLPSPSPNPPTKPPPVAKTYTNQFLAAITPTGIGAAPLPDVPDAPPEPITDKLSWSSIYFAGDLCKGVLDAQVPREHEVLVIRRGGCTFIDKLANIPSFTPTSKSLKLVIIISSENDDNDRPHTSDPNSDEKTQKNFDLDGGYLIRPLIDKVQTTPSGLVRHNSISMVMVGGGEEAEDMLRNARSIGIRRRYHIDSGGLVVGNILVV